MPDLAQVMTGHEEVVVMEPDGRMGRDELYRGLGEGLVHVAVTFPISVHEVYVARERMKQWPQDAIAKAVVVALIPFGRNIQPRQGWISLLIQLERSFLVVACCVTAPTQP